MISHLSSSTLPYTTGRLLTSIVSFFFSITVACHAAARYDYDTDHTEDGTYNEAGYIHIHSNRLLSFFMALCS